MVIVHGTYHADPHPGNVFGLPGRRWLTDLAAGRLTDRWNQSFSRTQSH